MTELNLDNINFLNESVEQKSYNESILGTIGIFAGTAILAGGIGYIVSKINSSINKNKILNNFEESDIKIRIVMATIEYKKNNIYKPVFDALNNAKIIISNGEKSLKDPKKIVALIAKCYETNIDINNEDFKYDDIFKVSSDVLNKIAKDAENISKSSNITKEELNKKLKKGGEYYNFFRNSYNEYLEMLKKLLNTGILYYDGGRDVVELYRNGNGYKYYNIIRGFINNDFIKSANEIYKYAREFNIADLNIDIKIDDILDDYDKE